MNLYFAVIIYFSAIFSRQRYNYDNVFCVVFSVRSLERDGGRFVKVRLV